MKILVEYVDGPFSHLENIWTFRDEDEASPRASNSSSTTNSAAALLGALMGSMFDVAFHKFADAFETRADKVYGRAPA